MTTRRPMARVEVWHDSALATWRPLAKDGADLPGSAQVAKSARAALSIGETMDLELVPSAAGEWRFEVRTTNGILLGTAPIRVLPR